MEVRLTSARSLGIRPVLLIGLLAVTQVSAPTLAAAEGANVAAFVCKGKETGKIEGWAAETELVFDCDGGECRTYFGAERFKTTRSKDGVFSAPAPHYFRFSAKDGSVQGVSGDPYYYFIGSCKKSKSASRLISKNLRAAKASNDRLDFDGFASEPPVQVGMSLHCRWLKSATLDLRGGASPTGEILPGGGSPLNLVVLGGKLVIVAEPENVPLVLIGMNKAHGAMFFGETTPIGNVVLWSLYTLGKNRRLFFKQNNYALSLDRVDAWNHAGICDVTGGNGRPIGN